MAPLSWATAKQTELLTSYVTLYKDQGTMRKYQLFWDTLNVAFLKEWPILPPPRTSLDMLNEEETQAYSDALAKLYKHIKQWYRWKCGS
ncbi:hypothetical protein H1R20_g9321, partial [Candolleomyces eurysporus]